MFVDASAIVAIITRELEADELADLVDTARAPITSPIALFEAVLGICRKRHASIDEAEEDVREFLELAGIELVPITAMEAETALSAFSRYGKGRDHPAQLSTSAIALPTPPPKTIAERYRDVLCANNTSPRRSFPRGNASIRCRVPARASGIPIERLAGDAFKPEKIPAAKSTAPFHEQDDDHE